MKFYIIFYLKTSNIRKLKKINNINDYSYIYKLPYDGK